MKKVLFGLFALSAVAFAAETNLYLRAGADLNGEYDVIKDEGYKCSDKEADDFSYEFAVEATREIYPNLEVGLGLAYQKHGDFKSYTYTESGSNYSYTTKYDMAGYTSIPLYVVAKYNFNAINNFVPYIKANLGYSFNDEDGDPKITFTGTSGGETHTEGYDGYETKIENGLYYGIGAGFEYNNFTMDLMYQVNEAEAKFNDKYYPEDSFKSDIDYSRITLGFGYKFNF